MQVLMYRNVVRVPMYHLVEGMSFLQEAVVVGGSNVEGWSN